MARGARVKVSKGVIQYGIVNCMEMGNGHTNLRMCMMWSPGEMGVE